MQHTDEELLILLALQEAEPDGETAAHLATCARCRIELDELVRVVDAGRTNLALTSALVPPPGHTWEKVARVVRHADTGARRADARADAEAPVGGPTVVTSIAPGARSRPRRRVPTWLAVAASLVVGMAGGGLLFQQLGTDQQPGVVVATARLSELGRDGTTGEAEVRETAAGPVLHVHVARRARGEGFREVWLLEPTTGRLFSVGVLNGTDSTFALPEGLDLRSYPTVDISREPFDGDPAHSADSIARGDLDV